MPHRAPARTAARGVRALVLAAVAVLGAALVLGLVYQSPDPSSWESLAHSSSPQPPTPAPSTAAPHGDRRTARGDAGGGLPDGATVFDDQLAGVANLDPDLLDALRRAATAAADDGVELFVNSGWRSPEYQDRLLRDAVSEYGSEQEAARWVATPDTSPHVSGDAVDVGPTAAAAWLSGHGAAYGLCQIYGNEPWHYELRPDATQAGCPPTYPDPTHDPRMQR